MLFEALPNHLPVSRIAVPCLGIDGLGHALKVMRLGADLINCYDLEESYRHALTKHLQELGMTHPKLHLGRVAGDLVPASLLSLERPVDFLISGPPCPPWSGQGKREGCKDTKARVFMAVVRWIVFFIYSAGLLGCILENVVGLTHQTADGREATSDKFLRALRTHCPQFNWSLEVLHLVDYMEPQTRTRVFIRGLNKIIASAIPPPLPAFGTRNLREALSPNISYTPRHTLTQCMQTNLAEFEKQAGQAVAGGKLGIDDVIVCPIDRSHAEEVVYAARWSVNCSPTLTTHNQYLFVLSVRDIIEQVGDSKREFFRFFTKPERLQLQGFPPKYALDLPEDKIIFAAGNSYPVPLMVACFFPMLKSLAESGLDLQRHPSAGMISDTIPACLPMVTRAMAAPGRIVNKVKHMQAQRHKSKRKKRALSEDSI